MRAAPAKKPASLSSFREMVADLERDGLNVQSPEGEETLFKLLGTTARGTKCGICKRGPLKWWEALNHKCEECLKRELAREERMAAAHAPDAYEAANVPQWYRSYTLARWDGVVPAKLHTWATTKPEDGKPFLILSGTTGIGKTHLACILLAAAYEKGDTALYVNARLLTGQLIEDSKIDSRPLWNTIQRARFLLLDDLGSEGKDRPIADEKLGEVIEARYLSGEKTCITTNLDLAAIYARDERIGSRLHTGFEWPMRGRDRRV